MDELTRFLQFAGLMFLVLGISLLLCIAVGVGIGKSLYDTERRHKPPPYDMPHEDSWE